MFKRLRFRAAGLVAVACTAGAMAAVALVAPAGSGAAPAEKEYAAQFEPECVLAPGVLNIRGKIKVSTRAMGPATVTPGEAVTLTGASSTITTPVEWTESFFTLGAREARGFVQTFLLESTNGEPKTINAAMPGEFPEGLPYKTAVEQGKELTFTAPSEGRTFNIGPIKVTGAAGESTKLTVSTEPGFEETAPGAFKATGKGIVSTTEGYNSEGHRVIGPLSVVCTAPPGVVLGEIPIAAASITSSESSSTTSASSSTTSESSSISTESPTSTTTSPETTTTTSPGSTTTTSPTKTTTTTKPTTTTTTTKAPSTTTTTTTSTASTVAGAPVVTRVVRNTGPSVGFTLVLIQGSNLAGEEEVCILSCKGVSVQFGEAKGFLLFDSPTQALVIAPPHAAGTVDVTVTVNGKTSATSAADRFTYVRFSLGGQENGPGSEDPPARDSQHGHGHH